MHRQARDAHLNAVATDSAGLVSSHAGEAPDPRGLAALRRRGYEMPRHRARRLVATDFVRQALILAMDTSNLAALREQCPQEFQYKLRLLLEFAAGPQGREVPDPFYGDAAGFERVLDLCEAGVRGLVDALRSGRLPVPEA